MGNQPQEQLRLGRISFLNVLPIYYPLESGIIDHDFAIVPGTPAHLNRLMAEGNLDISVVSSIEYARHPDRYFILPDLSISCCGPVRSVLLLSRVPIETLAGETILATTQSHTSVSLLKILLASRYGIEARLEEGRCTEALSRGEPPTAFLAIGDEALQLRDHALYPYRMDLGEAWHAWTGLPFVFAVWVVQRAAIARWNGRIGQAVETLAAAKRWGREHLDRICTEAVRKGILSYNDLEEYYHCLGFNLDSGEQRGLERFFEHLQQIGELCAAPRLEICSLLASVA